MTEYDWIKLHMTEHDHDWIWLNMTEYDWIWLWLNMTEYLLKQRWHWPSTFIPIMTITIINTLQMVKVTIITIILNKVMVSHIFDPCISPGQSLTSTITHNSPDLSEGPIRPIYLIHSFYDLWAIWGQYEHHYHKFIIIIIISIPINTLPNINILKMVQNLCHNHE